MADVLSEFLFIRYYFGREIIPDRKKLIPMKQQFLLDMQFNLNRGHVTRTTDKLHKRKFFVSKKKLNVLERSTRHF